MNLLQQLNHTLGGVMRGFITIYQHTISPDKGVFSPWLKGKVCSHEPHCSKYGKECFERYGFRPGMLYTMDRISSCTPQMTIQHDPSHYKVIFFSSAPIGVPFLEQLSKDKRFEIVGVVTAPDRASGRGLEMKPNVVKARAEEIGIDVILTPEKINPDKSDEGKAFTEEVKKLDADFFVVVAYGKIMPQSVLDIPKVGPINVHGSLLPKYRGASPIQAALLHNESMTGVTIMYMDAKMDEGDELAKLGFSVDFSWTAEDLTEKMTQIGPELLCNTLRDFGKEHIGRTPQDHANATTCTKIAKTDGEVDPRQTPLGEVYNKYRAYYAWPKIYFMHNEKRVIIEKLTLDKKLFDPTALLVDAMTHRLHEGIMECVVKPEGKKAMSRDEFTRGYLAL